MKKISLLAASILFAAIFAGSALAQGGAAQPAAGVKFAVINTGAFEDDKAGVTKYINAMNALEKEFLPLNTEISGMMTRYTSLAAEIKKLSEAPANLIDQKTINAKAEEGQTLEVNIKRKQEDGKAKFERRQKEVMGPVMQDLGKAMDEFAKQKGYALILDAAKLDSAGLILAFDPAKIDVTKEFITFYNARQATTATTATPR